MPYFSRCYPSNKRSKYTQKAGLPGVYAACALLGLVRNAAEAWVALGDLDLPAIQVILRKHDCCRWRPPSSP